MGFAEPLRAEKQIPKACQKLTQIPKNVVITKLFAPKFRAECTDRELHSSHGDHFLDHFHVYVSRPKS